MLTPEEIYAEIESHPPLMREDAQRAYAGKEVEWLLRFVNGSARQEEARLTFWSEGGRSRMVVGKVSLATYPWLKSLPQGETVRVRGRITEIDSLIVNIDILELSLPQGAAASS
jgi:hypothetical protein